MDIIRKDFSRIISHFSIFAHLRCSRCGSIRNSWDRAIYRCLTASSAFCLRSPFILPTIFTNAGSDPPLFASSFTQTVTKSSVSFFARFSVESFWIIVFH